ncbi:MAG: FAD/NAD(P)-binding oxidoreductase [Vulcanimicrobiaceae bacterium]
MAVVSPSIELQSRNGATERHFRTLIVGGGTAGIAVSARLRAAGQNEVAIVEPSDKHYYQPLWTLVGGGIMPKEESERAEADYIPAGVTWIRDRVTTFEPDANAAMLASGGRLTYDFLIIAPGIQVDWNRVDGLEETLGRNGVSSNYRYDLAPMTWKFIEEFRGGTALFTFPAGPIKCAGAPQKIMYLAADYWRKHKVAAHIVYASAAPAIFGVKAYQEPLNRVIARYGIETKFNRNLVAVDGPARTATFAIVGDADGGKETISFDMMHVVPPQSAPDFIKASPFAETEGPQKGYVKVDKGSMQSAHFPNVFALGDAGSTPNSKTGAAIRKQAPIVVENVLAAMAGAPVKGGYDGYASCPLVTGYGKLILAEFDYDGNPTPSVPLIDTTKERWSMYMLKRHGLPWMYWNLMMRGKA